MRKLLLVIPFVVGFSGDYKTPVEPMVKIEPKEVQIEVDVVEPTIKIKEHQNLEPLIMAMMWVESRHNDSAYNKREDAVGCLQIRPIMLAECNRILELQNTDKRYTLEDRWSRIKSIQIFYVVNNYHHNNGTYEEIARAWNGGPKWAEKSGTKRYWRKVQKQLKKQSKENERSNNRLAEI